VFVFSDMKGDRVLDRHHLRTKQARTLRMIPELPKSRPTAVLTNMNPILNMCKHHIMLKTRMGSTLLNWKMTCVSFTWNRGDHLVGLDCRRSANCRSLVIVAPKCTFKDICGSRDKCLFSVIRGHLNNVLMKQNSCFNNKTSITNFCFKIKQKICKRTSEPQHIQLPIG